MRRTSIVGVILSWFLIASAGAATLQLPSSPAHGSFGEPRLSVGPEGYLYLVWTGQQSADAHHLFFNRSRDGGATWPPYVWLDPDKAAGSWSSSPQVHSDGRGGVYVVWRMKHANGDKEVRFAASRDFGATFGPPRKLNRQGGAFAPQLSVDGTGHLYVVWSDERPEAGGSGRGRAQGSHYIYFNRSTDGGRTWLEQDVKLNGEPPVPLNPVMRAWPTIRSDAHGHVYVAWFDNRDGEGSIYFRASDDFAATWGAEQRVKADGRGDVLGPIHLAADAQGHVYLAWVDDRDGAYGVYFAASADFGRSWGKEVRLDNAKTKAAPSIAPAIACDGAGHVYVVWQDARHGGWDVYLNASADFGRTWRSREIRLNSGPAGESEATLPQLALDGKGRVAVVWQENRGPQQEEGIYLTWSTDFGETWRHPDLRVDDSQAGSLGLKPQIALGLDGGVVIAWEAHRPDRQGIALRVLHPQELQTATR
jgi:hypothetical protein